MNLDRIFNVAGSIIVLAIVATIVASPNSAKVVSSVGGAFSNAIRSAKGGR